METSSSSETLMSVYEHTGRHITDDCYLLQHTCKISTLDKKQVIYRYPISYFSTVKVFNLPYSSSPSSISECPTAAVSAPQI